MTAVQWFFDQYIMNKGVMFVGVLNKAIEMEKEQIEDAFHEGIWNGWEAKESGKEFIDPTQYYNNTYGK